MNIFGTILKLSIYGESHQKEIGFVLDGLPAGLKLDLEQIRHDLNLRRPTAVGTTTRKEADEFEISSGYFNDFTTGAPLHLSIANLDIKSKDYDSLVNHPRPGHADLTAKTRYQSFNDHRGGGHFSGRLTTVIVAAGAIAKQLTPFKYEYQITNLGGLKDLTQIDQYLTQIKADKDSVGGIIQVRIKDVPIGLGNPFFGKVDALLGQVLFAIPAVKGIWFGTSDFSKKGSQYNDLIIDQTGKSLTNHQGGITGGITNGNDIIINVYVKPTSSIGMSQETYHLGTKKVESLTITGRHDSAIIQRIGVVLTNACALVMSDLFMINKVYK
jgi:chorismate synthase